MIVTDSFDQVAGEYAALAIDRISETATASDYTSAKADGARASAKTIRLPDDQTVIVASDGLLGLGEDKARRIMLHEAQHVRIGQRGDMAWAVHRKVDFDKPRNLAWEYLWNAESFIDEFRCERTLQERGYDSLGMGSEVDDYPRIAALFGRVRQDFALSRDLQAAYRSAFAALDRLNAYLAYAAGLVVARPDERTLWSGVRPLGDLLGVVEEIPGAAREISDDDLLRHALVIARLLRKIGNSLGFDYRMMLDYSTYFEFLRA